MQNCEKKLLNENKVTLKKSQGIKFLIYSTHIKEKLLRIITKLPKANFNCFLW